MIRPKVKRNIRVSGQDGIVQEKRSIVDIVKKKGKDVRVVRETVYFADLKRVMLVFHITDLKY